MAENEYKISLGVDVDVSDIQAQINTKAGKLDKIPIKVEIENLKELKSQIQDLGKGNKNLLTFDTSKIESSLKDVKNVITDIRTALGTIDDSKGINSLVSSVDKINKVLDTASNKIESLSGELSALSKKDFSINLDIDMGKKNLNTIGYGRAARKQVIPELESQIKYLEDLFGGQQSAMKKLTRNNKEVDFDIFSDFNDFNSDSAIKKMEAMEKYVNSLKKLASIEGIKLDGFNEIHKNASELINDITGVDNAVDKAVDVPQKLKNLLGGSNIDAEGLSTQLDSIVADLGEIKTAIQGLSSGTSIDGLTQSFNRLSETLDKLATNANLVQNVLGSGFSDAAKSQLNLDDVIDQQVLKLMDKYAVTGTKAFDEIRQSLVDFRNGSGDINKVTSAISNNMKVVNEAKNDYKDLAEYIKMFNASGAKVHIPDSIRQEYGDDYKSMRSQLGKGFTSGQGMDFETFIVELNSILGDTIDLSHGAEAAFGDLVNKVNSTKGSKFLTGDDLFKNGILNMGDVVANVSTSLEQIENAEEEIARTSTSVTNTVVQNEERKQQAYRDTKRLISDSAKEAIDNVSSKSIDESFKIDEASSAKFRREMESLVSQWTDAKGELTDIKIDTTTVYDKDTERNIEKLRQAQVTYNNELGETIKKTIAWRQIGSEVNTVDGKEIDTPIYGFVEVAGQYSKTLGKTRVQTDTFVKQQKQAVSNLTNQINQMNRAANDQNAARPIKDTSHLDVLESKYNEITAAIQKMENASSDIFVDEQNNVKKLISEFKSLVSEFKNAENVSTKMKGTDFASGLEIAKNDLEKFKAQAKDFPQIIQTIENLDRAIEGVGDASSLNKFNDQLRVARSELAKIKSETSAANRNEKVGINVSGLESKIVDLQRISPEIDKFEAEIDGAKVTVQSLLNDLKQVNTQGDFSVVNSRFRAFADSAKAAGIAVTETVAKVKSIDDIKLDIELGNYDNQISQMDDKFKRLSGASKELRDGVEQVKNAYHEMELAIQGTGDEVADRKRLIQAEKDYADALERTNNLIRIQARTEKAEADKQRLVDDREVFQAKIDTWLTKNSAATKKFGAEMLDLKAKAENCDRVTLNHLEKQFTKVDKAADKAGLKMQSLGDRIKDKAKEYMAYFSVAEIFMEVTQALKRMFDTVVEIDTAMTGLYRVTDLTSAQYDTLFNNMISSAKEYGATLNDIINATTDWVRAGFDADTALGLAEVTTMYQHISDLDYDTAAENLITAYNGFKDELNGAFNGDTVGAVNYIADIFNELDNNFAVTSAGLGEALTRSASALDLAGNSIQETAGMVTGIVEVTQDPEKAGSALKVLSLRLRGMKGQLEELGEETDENVENISKMQGQILNMTGGKVNIFDASGNFKSTYEIMKGIAEVWDDLSSIDQANLLETIAGKNRANDVAALLSNWKNVEAAVKSASEAEGSAARENAKYVDSLQGRLDKLTTAWQSFANTFMNSDFLKGGISTLTTFVELIEKLVDSLGTAGTIGLGAGIFGIFKNRSSFSGILGSLSAFGQLASDAWRSGGKLTTRFKDIGNAAGMAGGDIAKSFTGSLSGMIGGIGLAIAAIELIINAYKDYKEEQSRIRQETIEASDSFLDAAGSFEQAYIKYSGKTSLTEEEETELSSAIKGTVDALDDKSSALQGVVNSSNDYLVSLEQIADAEIEEASRVAKAKRDAAEKELKEVAIGYESFDGSEVDITTLNQAIGVGDVEANRIAKEMNSKFLKYQDVTTARSPKRMDSYTFTLSGDADVNEIIEYYYTLLEYQEKLSDADLIDTGVYEKVTTAIDKMSESIGVYTDGVYEAVKAQYQLDEGIPKTTEEYLKMREAILRHNDINGLSVDTKKTIAGTLDSEYGQVFDLSTAEVQSRKFIGILEEYGDGEAKQIETFLNMRTKVNNHECTVGDYISQFDDINTMTEDWGQDAKDELNTTFGLDTDAIKEQYDEVYNYLQNKDLPVLDGYKNTPEFRLEKDNIKQQEIKDFLDELSVYELEAVANLKGEIDWETDSFDNIIKSIEEEAKLIEALSFSIDLDIETEKLDNLTTAISESFSGAGLGTTSMSLVKDMFGELDNYDPSLLFERTSTGMRLNREELKKLNDEYKNTNIDGLENKMSALGDRYIQTRDELSELTYGSEEYKEKARDLSDIEAEINATETLISQYKGLTNAYSEWQRVESSGQERDMYESVIEGFENVGDEISRGWIDDGSIEFLELLTGKTDLASKSAKELKQEWKDLDKKINGKYSVRDFFTTDEDGNSTSDGVYNFLKTVEAETEKFNGKDVIKRKDGKKDGEIIEFDFQVVGGNEAIAEALGISEELVDIMVRAADDAGFVVSMDGTYQQLDVLKKKAQEAATALKNTFKKTEFEFDLYTSDEGSIEKQYQEALKIWEPFTKNKKADGTIDMTVKGAEEAYTLVSTLQSMVDKLSEPVYMELNATQVEKDMQTPLSKLQEYERLVQSEHQLRLKGTDTSELEADKEEIINYFDELQEKSPEIAAELGIKDLTREEIQAKVEAGEIEIPATIDLQVEMNNTLRDMVNIALYNAGLLGEGEEGKAELEKRVDIDVYADKIDTTDVEEKTEDAVDKATDGDSARKKNIEIIAETFGIKEVNDLSSKLEGLDDKTVQAIAEVLGQVDVDKLKLAMSTLTDTQVKAIAEAVGKGDVEGLKTAINGMDSNTVQAIAEAFGYNDVNELIGAIDKLDPKTVQAVAQALGLGDVNTLQVTINNMQGNTVDAKVDTSGQAGKVNSLQITIDGMQGNTVTAGVNTDGQASKIDTLQTKINSLKGKIVNVGVQLAAGGKKKAAQRTGADPAGNDSEVNGTANVNGTAFSQGNWRTKRNETALTGELGREIVVTPQNRWYTVGDNGAEFVNIPRGSIVFNHRQTEELLKNGRAISDGGRARAYVSGTAFSKGTGGGIEAEVTSIVVGTNKNTGKSYSKSKDNKDFEETFDWIEIAISRVERAIDRLDQKANNVYKNWSYRNNALTSQIGEVRNEINLQQRAYNEYMAAANAVGLSSSWASKVRNGQVDISTIKDEALADKISDYQDWYEKALDCQDAILELQEIEAALYKQRFDNVATEYEGILSIIEHEKNMLEEYISQSEAQAWLISSKYYDALAKNEQKNISKLKQEKNALLSSFNSAMQSGTIAKYSEAWYEMVNAVDEVTLAITEGETALKEYAQAIQEIKFEQFDLLQDRISSITEETDFLIELLSSDKLYDDKGQLTNEGSATMGLHGVAYNTYMYQADQAAKEAERLKKELAKDSYDTDLESRYREMIALQQEYILNAQDQKEAIRDLVSNGIELELDSLSELIDKYNEALDSEKDLYEYQKKVKEQTEEIADIEKMLSSYSGDDSEEAKAKIQELKVSLDEAKSDLEETEYDKYISDTQKILDDLYLEYETILNERLDNIDALLSDMILQINSDASIISDTINASADSVGYTLTESMNTIWSGANNVITTYGEKFFSAQTTTNNALQAINTNLQNMINQLNKKAETNVKTASTSSASSSSKSSSTSSNSNSKPSTQTNTNTSKDIKVGSVINAGNAPIYDYAGDTTKERQYYRNDPTYVVLAEKGDYVQVRKDGLSGGVTGWFKKSDIGYKTGVKNLSDSELAWTQEGKKQEYIIRPSDGAILTPLAKGDSVLNANATNNIWNMANTPAEFIKDNLNLGVTNIPNNSNVNNNITQSINANLNFPNVKSYEEMLIALSRDPKFQKLVNAMTADQYMGKSSLAKGKSIR